MTLLKRTPVLMIVLCSTLSAAPLQQGGGRRDADAKRLTGVLRSVNVKGGTFTLEQIGVDVDEALARKLKERGKVAGGTTATPQAADGGKSQVLKVGAATKIYISFRSSPSVSNNLERELSDLQAMVGFPMTVELGANGEPPVAATVTAWRGTPWKLRC